ncbi:uncharacterized protein LOC121530016 [Drosophila eugracilis]|uniref:uncharacterized protein LOC121530016 n=1 Tax=Drosophila eugracilis TaxID=29029 RepID=UPI001BD9242E|nr:uncharacterized protein LOC121530016 [Drosophila eugracilis]
MDNPRTITDLPFEVLDLIFTELLYLRYKVDLALTHEKLGKAFAFHSRNEFRTLKPSTALTGESWAFIVKECGTSIEELFYDVRGIYWNDLIAQTVVKHCPNLKSVSTRLYRGQDISFQSFLKQMKNSLISVTVKQENSFPLEILKVVGEMTQLKHLSLKIFADENVNQIHNCVGLETLELEHHYYMRKHSVNLLRICAPLKNLRDLSVTNIKIPPLEDSNSNIWVSMETLALILCEFSELPDCPQLKWLRIYNPICHIENYGLKFILKNGRNLKTLHEDCNPPIGPDGFLQVLRSCPKLRGFYTPMEYIKLYSGYVSAILEILKENGVTREDPLELVICRRIKWKWFRRLLLRAPNAELIDLYESAD